MASALLHLLPLAFLALAYGATLHSGVQIPTFARVCYRDDPEVDLNECLKESLQTLLKRISGEGIRQINLPPLDPWHVDKLTMTFGNGEPFKVSFTSLNSNTYGFSRIKIHDVRAELDDPKRITIEVDFSNDKIFTEGEYEAEGTISDFPVLGKGTYNVSIFDCSGTFKLKGHVVERDGHEFLLIDRATMRPDVGNMTVGMTNENNKYPELTNLFIGLMNQFWKSIYQELLPYAEDMFDQIMRPTFNLATLKIPYDQLIPKHPKA